MVNGFNPTDVQNLQSFSTWLQPPDDHPKHLDVTFWRGYCVRALDRQSPHSLREQRDAILQRQLDAAFTRSNSNSKHPYLAVIANHLGFYAILPVSSTAANQSM